MKRFLFIFIALLFLVIIIVAVMMTAKNASQPAVDDTATSLPSKLLVNPEDPYQGQLEAPVTIIEFGSFTCSSCKASAATVKQVQALYPTKVKIVWKDFPLDSDISKSAALAARCAQIQGKFWEYHDLLFAQTGTLQSADLTRIAQELNLRMPEFSRCLSENQTLYLIEKNIQEGNGQQLEAIPYFDVNGQQIVTGDIPLGRWQQLIDQF